MQELGFKEVYDMAGGIRDWIAAGFPTVEQENGFTLHRVCEEKEIND